jgi:RNA polymerase nonessential primary-like sigma factor
MTRAIAQQGRTICLPIHITEKLNKIKSTQRELSQKLGRTPSTAEIAQVLDLEPDQIRQHWLSARQTVSLEMRVGTELDTDLLLDQLRGQIPDNFCEVGDLVDHE